MLRLRPLLIAMSITLTACGTTDKPGTSFADELHSAKGVQFSKHAAERVERRGMTEDPQTVKRLENGVDLAASKGSRAAVVMVDDNAFVRPSCRRSRRRSPGRSWKSVTVSAETRTPSGCEARACISPDAVPPENQASCSLPAAPIVLGRTP